MTRGDWAIAVVCGILAGVLFALAAAIALNLAVYL